MQTNFQSSLLSWFLRAKLSLANNVLRHRNQLAAQVHRLYFVSTGNTSAFTGYSSWDSNPALQAQKNENRETFTLTLGKGTFMWKGQSSLRSRCLEVVGTRNDRHMRERHARGEEASCALTTSKCLLCRLGTEMSVVLLSVQFKMPMLSPIQILPRAVH